MARPKTGNPTKLKMTLTVSAQSRENLSLISQHYKESISSLVEKWAEKELAEIKRKENK